MVSQTPHTETRSGQGSGDTLQARGKGLLHRVDSASATFQTDPFCICQVELPSRRWLRMNSDETYCEDAHWKVPCQY